MKPYLAILIDSFWEAVTSKVLWALLIGWSLLLAGLAPFGYIVERGYELSNGDVRNPLGLAQKMARGLTPDGTPQQQAISAHLSDSMKKRLGEANGKSDRDARLQRISRRELVRELNRLLKDRDLFDPKAFESIAQRESLKSIVTQDAKSRSAEEVEQLNRELFRSAYAADILTPRSEQAWVGYAGIKLGDSIPLSRREFNLIIERIALEIIIRLGISFITVFVGLIITSPMIPETFRSGSLHLLLSKPIARPLVFLTKFFGGTVFVLVNMAFVLTGLYLLVGWRLDIWNIGLLYCIPLLLFVFIIFYSVSALTGLIWNNPIICVVVCIVFWIFCMVIGVLETFMRIPAEYMPQLVRFQMVGQNMLGVTRSGTVRVWNEDFQVWQPAVDQRQEDVGRVLGPIYDEKRQRLIMRSDFLNDMGDYETRNRNFVVADLKQPNVPSATKTNDASSTPSTTTTKSASGEAASSEPASSESASDSVGELSDEEVLAEDDASIPKNAEEANRKARWASELGVEPPMLMLDLIEFGNRTLAVSRNGIFEIDWEAQDAAEAVKSVGSIFGNLSRWIERSQPKVFKELTPPEYVFGDRVRVCKTPDNTRLFIYNSNTIDCLRLDEAAGKFKVEHSIKLPGDERQAALIAATNNHCLVAREAAPMELLPANLEKVIASIDLPGASDPRQLLDVPSSEEFSLVNHEGYWFTIDASESAATAKKVDFPWQGSVTGVTWMADELVCVGVRPKRAMMWNTKDKKVEMTFEPSMTRLDFVYHYIVHPLYYISPKPSSLSGVLSKLLSRQSSGQSRIFTTDLASGRDEIEIWQPIISNLVFVAVILTIGCIYVWRKEY